jgi:hypothetical protein
MLSTNEIMQVVKCMTMHLCLRDKGNGGWWGKERLKRVQTQEVGNLNTLKTIEYVPKVAGNFLPKTNIS